jgi:hypothetical protein
VGLWRRGWREPRLTKLLGGTLVRAQRTRRLLSTARDRAFLPGRLGDIGIAGGFLSDHGFGDTIDGVMTVVGLALVAIGVLGLATGFGLWRGRNWAWLITRLWASVCIVVGVVGAALPLLGDTLTSSILGAVVGSAGTAIVAAVVLWYLYQPRVKAMFGRT